jgi:uncharacterized RDD family membrane protein YckC
MNYYAKLRKRAAASFVDYGIVFTLTFSYTFTFGRPNAEGVQSVDGVEGLPVFGLWLIYFPIVEGMTGQTLGKKVVGTRVATLSGGDVGVWKSFIRHLFDMIDFLFFGLIGILVVRSTDKRQRVGDLIAKTIVIENNHAACTNCKEEFMLSFHEFTTGRFICPRCKHENKI